MKNNVITCYPSNDSNKRILLGIRGSSDLLAISLNPSTANEVKLDPTSRNIKAIAKKNGCDGWWIINLYPKRTSKPGYLPKKCNIALAKENVDYINKIIHDESLNLSKVVCCWGNHINDHPYLKEQAKKIINLLKKVNIKFYCIGLTKLGNPYHPAPMAVNRFLGGIDNIKLKEFTP